MADDFETPRASKRRRTATYAGGRTILGEIQSGDNPADKKNATKQSNRKSSISENDNSVQSSAPVVNAGQRSTTPDIEGNLDSEQLSVGKQRGASVQQHSENTARLSARKRSSQRSADSDGLAANAHTLPATKVAPERATTPDLASVRSEDEDDVSQTSAIQPRSSGRERRRPRRFSISPEKPKPKRPLDAKEANSRQGSIASDKTPAGTPLKGILTPSGRREKRGPRKSVVFDQAEPKSTEPFAFKDIDVSVKSSTKKSRDVTNETPTKKARASKKSETIAKETTSEGDVAFNLVDDDDVLDLNLDHLLQSGEANEILGVSEPAAISLAISQAEETMDMLQVRLTVLARLLRGSSKKLQADRLPAHLESPYISLRNLLAATVTSGESNSLLLLGSRGSGKSHLIESTLSDMRSKYGTDFHTVRLNGFYQTDDKVALREIWRQLGKEMQVDEEETEGAGGSYADTMASLLSLLSHPDEFGVPETDAMHIDVNVDQDQGQRTSKSIIFVLDEFDLFTTHPRQTLLYNLFDIAQSRKAPIAVIGCSTRMDVVDCLEKRVKSRFSHRWLHISSVKNMDGFQETVTTMLCVDLKVVPSDLSREQIDARQRWNDYIQATFLPSQEIQALIKRNFYTTKSLPELFTSLYLPVATAFVTSTISSNPDRIKDLSTLSITPLDYPSQLNLLPTLPTLHLALLVAASRLDTIHNLTATNFNLTYNHYSELVGRSKLQQTASGAVAIGAGLRQWTQQTAKTAWEDLGSWGCIAPVLSGSGTKDGTGDSVGGEGASVRMWKVDVTLDDLDWAIKQKWPYGGGMVDVLSKWCKEV